MGAVILWMSVYAGNVGDVVLQDRFYTVDDCEFFVNQYYQKMSAGGLRYQSHICHDTGGEK